MSQPEQEVWAEAAVEQINPPVSTEPVIGAPTYTDRVRFGLALGLIVVVASICAAMLALVAWKLLTISDAKELAITFAALFGIVSPVIAFYFAAAKG